MPKRPDPTTINERQLLGKYDWPMYPIQYAIRENDPDLLKQYIDGGADPNIDLVEGWTPLHSVIDGAIDGMAQNGDTQFSKETIKIMKILVAAGADLNKQTNEGLKPLDLINEYAYDREGFAKLLDLFRPVFRKIETLITYDGYIK